MRNPAMCMSPCAPAHMLPPLLPTTAVPYLKLTIIKELVRIAMKQLPTAMTSYCSLCSSLPVQVETYNNYPKQTVPTRVVHLMAVWQRTMDILNVHIWDIAAETFCLRVSSLALNNAIIMQHRTSGMKPCKHAASAAQIGLYSPNMCCILLSYRSCQSLKWNAPNWLDCCMTWFYLYTSL